MIETKVEEALFLNRMVDEVGQRFYSWPLAPEAHIATWQRYVEESQENSVWDTLQTYLPQLRFPIQAGISKTKAYGAVTKRGQSPLFCPLATGLVLQEPDKLELFIHDSAAGAIPVIQAGTHGDFSALVQAILKRNEPVTIPASTGAYMVSGYNNWERIRVYRATWVAQNPDHCSERDWQLAFKQIIPQKHLYQDRFIILYGGPYSGISAIDLGLADTEWRVLSLKIRLEHECTHYFTKRVFGVMRRHVFDELLADYAGITAAIGRFRSDWFLHFMGLEDYPQYREGGRLQNYLDEPPGSDPFTAVQSTLKAAAENLELFDTEEGQTRRDLRGRALMLLAITRLNLAQLALPKAPHLLCEALYELEKQEGE